MADSMNPTVVAASLDDKDLQNSINRLVQFVADKTNEMAKSMDSAVDRMTKKLKELGNPNIIGSGNTSGVTARTRVHTEEGKAIESTTAKIDKQTIAFDTLAQAKDRATRKNKNIEYVTLSSDVDKELTYLVNVNKDVDAQLNAILEKERSLITEKAKEEQITRSIAEANANIAKGVSGATLGYGTINDMQQNSKRLNEQSQALENNARSVRNQRMAYSELEQTVSTYLGLSMEEMNISTSKNASYNMLSSSLRQMVTAYHEMNETERNSSVGQNLADGIQKARRSLQQIQQQMERPIHLKDALDAPAKTLDEMSQKMQMLQRYRAGMDLSNPNDMKMKQDLEAINTELDKLRKKQNEILGQNKTLLESNNALGRSWNYMKNRLAFYFTVGASTAFVKNLIEVRSQYEMNERALGILVDSAERGTQIFKELSEMSLVSPYTLIELSNAARQLTAYDIAAKDVVDTTRRLADMASAVGVPIERLTYALGQIKAYGYLNSRDARMFANAGIPLVKQLADYYSELEGRIVSTADVYDRMKKKAIEYNDVMAVVTKMTDEGGKFFDFQAKMADTLKVRLANLNLAWNNMLNDIGQSKQGAITWTIGALRDLFLQWRSIDKAMYDVFYSFGTFKGIQLIMLLVNGELKTMDGWTKLVGKSLTNLGVGIGRAFKQAFAIIAANPWTATFTALAAVLVSVIRHSLEVKRHMKEMNESIVKAAKESSEALDKYLNRESTKQNRLAAKSNTLSATTSQKAWEEYRNEIELSVTNSDELIANLMKTENINERLSQAFDLAEKIKIANDKLSLLGETALEISQDSILYGSFGEGLSEDVQDYIERVQKARNAALDPSKAEYHVITLEDKTEAEREMRLLADDLVTILNDRLQGDVGDPEILSQSIEILRNKIKENEPKIKGEFAQYFDVQLDKLLGERFGDLYDTETSLRRQFLTILKKDYSSAFKNVTDDILNENAKWGDDQEKAIQKAAAELKKTTVPEFHNAIDEMVKYMNSQDWRIRIVTTMGTERMTDFQRDFESRMKEMYGNVQFEDIFKKYMPKAGDELPEWTKNTIDALDKVNKDIEVYARDAGEHSKLMKQAAEDERDALEKSLQAFNQPLKKETKSGGSKKDVLGESFGKVTQVIENTRKRFKEYRDAGVDAQEALTLATNEYGNTLAQNNAILNKFGIQTKNTDEIMTMDMRNVREYYNTLLDGAKRVGNAKGIEVLEKAIAGLNVEIAKTDYKKVTEGLNNELGRLKDEYELSIELDADPEMSDMFLNMFDIDGNTLPKTIDDVAERALRMFNEAFSRYHIELPTFDLTDDDLRAYESQVEQGLINADAFETIKKQTLALREMRRKEATDTLKQTEELRYKLADNAEKIALKEKEVADLRKKLNAETQEDSRRLLELKIQDTQREIDELRSGVLQMTETYQALFGGLVERSAYASRRIAQDLKRAYELARKGGRDENGRYTYTDPRSGEQVKLTQHQLGNEMNKVAKEIQKTATVFSKLREAFTKGEDKETDYVKGLELIGEEAKKAADGVRAVTQIVQDLGGEDAEQTVEVMNDLATAMEGLGDAATGVAQIYNGDIIGGVTNVIKGLWSAIGSWFDNGDKKITRMIEKSEREVKRLELAYSKLERAAEESFGADEIAARRAMITNIQLRLEEEKRQLALEESRKGKKRDEDAIIEHQKAVADAEKSLHDAVEGLSEMLLGSNMKGAAEDFVSTWVNAWREGESTMDALNGKFDDMIDNMIVKSLASKVVAKKLKGVFDVIETFTGNETDAEMWEKLKNAKNIIGNGSFADDINRELTALFNYLGIPFGSGNASGLSDLQQGIKGITEDQAGALEAYWNANTQQQYIHTDLLTQIRDMMASYNMDVQLGTMGQILLQLQQSYLAQMAIRGIMEGWTSPSGMSVRVEMVS